MVLSVETAPIQAYLTLIWWDCPEISLCGPPRFFHQKSPNFGGSKMVKTSSELDIYRWWFHDLSGFSRSCLCGKSSKEIDDLTPESSLGWRNVAKCSKVSRPEIHLRLYQDLVPKSSMASQYSTNMAAWEIPMTSIEMDIYSWENHL